MHGPVLKTCRNQRSTSCRAVNIQSPKSLQSSLCSSAPSLSRDFDFISSTFARRSTYFSGDITIPTSQVMDILSTHPPERLAHPRSPIPPLSTLTSRATHAHPTSPRSTGFCAIWDCISSRSSSHLRTQKHVLPRRHHIPTLQVTKARPTTTVAPTCASVHSWRCFWHPLYDFSQSKDSDNQTHTHAH